MLSHLHLTFQHRAGVRPYTSCYHLAESCVFAKQSLPPILCHLLLRRYPLFRSYGIILPSSFKMVLSSALVYSTSLPVSVLVRSIYTYKLFLVPYNYFAIIFKAVTYIWFFNFKKFPSTEAYAYYLRGRLTYTKFILT